MVRLIDRPDMAVIFANAYDVRCLRYYGSGKVLYAQW